MKRIALAAVLMGALAAPVSASASKVDYAEAWFKSRPHAALVICDSTPSWQGRKFPIYCGVGYEAGRWSDYRVRIVRGRVDAHRFHTERWFDVVPCDEPCPVEAF